MKNYDRGISGEKNYDERKREAFMKIGWSDGG